MAVTPSEPWSSQVRSGPWPMASRTRSQSMMNSVPATGSGRRRPEASGAPSAMRWNSTPVTLPFSSVTTRVGAAWKMARAPSSMHLVDLVGGGHVLHVAAVDERHLAGALADRGAGAVHGGEAAADDDDALARVAGVGQAEGRDAQVLEAVEDAVGVLAGDAQLVGVVAADGHADGVEALVLQVVDGEVAAQLGVADERTPRSQRLWYSPSRTSTLGRRYCGMP